MSTPRPTPASALSLETVADSATVAGLSSSSRMRLEVGEGGCPTLGRDINLRGSGVVAPW